MAERRHKTALSHEAEVGVKWNIRAWVVREPFEDLRMFVGGVIVGDGVDDFASGTFRSTALRKRMNS